MQATVTVTLKNGVLDPQGAAMENTLKQLGFDGVSDVRVGKHITLSIDAPNRELAEAQAKAMCEALLANTVIESYRVELA